MNENVNKIENEEINVEVVKPEGFICKVKNTLKKHCKITKVIGLAALSAVAYTIGKNAGRKELEAYDESVIDVDCVEIEDEDSEE